MQPTFSWLRGAVWLVMRPVRFLALLPAVIHVAAADTAEEFLPVVALAAHAAELLDEDGVLVLGLDDHKPSGVSLLEGRGGGGEFVRQIAKRLLDGRRPEAELLLEHVVIVDPDVKGQQDHLCEEHDRLPVAQPDRHDTGARDHGQRAAMLEERGRRVADALMDPALVECAHGQPGERLAYNLAHVGREHVGGFVVGRAERHGLFALGDEVDDLYSRLVSAQTYGVFVYANDAVEALGSAGRRFECGPDRVGHRHKCVYQGHRGGHILCVVIHGLLVDFEVYGVPVWIELVEPVSWEGYVRSLLHERHRHGAEAQFEVVHPNFWEYVAEF